MKCRHCGTALTQSFIDLGSSPPSNAYLTDKALTEPEKWYPLKVMVCDHCWLVQTEDFVGAGEMFSEEYAYFSSFSSSWLAHAERYVNEIVERFHLNKNSCVVEVAANDGYLLQYVENKAIPCYGIEPTHSTAEAAREKGIEIREEFFGIKLAERLVAEGKSADLTAANNVLAHVPDINDFVSGFKILLKPQGVATFEFPHLLNLVQQSQFDTIYHEHYSYLSLTSVTKIFLANGLSVFDVQQLPTHGGSLRVFAKRADSNFAPINPSVDQLLQQELDAGMLSLSFYQGLQQQAEQIKNDLLVFLIEAKKQGKRIAAYGAAAKGNTLLNYCGIRPDLLVFVADKNPAKQNKWMPGSHIPIVSEETIMAEKPEYLIILPWNLKDEIMQQLDYTRAWGAQFVVAVPKLEVL